MFFSTIDFAFLAFILAFVGVPCVLGAFIVACGILVRTLRRRMDERLNEAQAELDDAKDTVRKFELSVWNVGKGDPS